MNSAAFLASIDPPSPNSSPALRPTEFRVAGFLVRAEPVRTVGAQTTWRVSVGENGSLGSFETRFSGQFGAAQMVSGTPPYKQLREVLCDAGASRRAAVCESL
jgi:hypothetical protein